jgi:hypothetical protein
MPCVPYEGASSTLDPYLKTRPILGVAMTRVYENAYTCWKLRGATNQKEATRLKPRHYWAGLEPIIREQASTAKGAMAWLQFVVIRNSLVSLNPSPISSSLCSARGVFSAYCTHKPHGVRSWPPHPQLLAMFADERRMRVHVATAVYPRGFSPGLLETKGLLIS